MQQKRLSTRLAAVSALTMICASGVAAATAQSAIDRTSSARPQPPITVIASGLQDPYEVSGFRNRLVVTESAAGQVVSINPRQPNGAVTLAGGLGKGVPSGAVKIGRRTFIVTGEAGGPPDRTLPGAPYSGSAVLVAQFNRKTHSTQIDNFADLLAFEKAHNPDGQTQYGPGGTPLDALSNPFYVIRKRYVPPGKRPVLLVADGGANDVLQVNRHGKVSAFFVPPTVNTGACQGRPNNDANTVGCDAVPTGLAYGPNHNLYVSALTGEAPGEGRVYVLNEFTGKVKWVISGFTAPTGVAVAPNGTVYVSEVMEGMPQGPPPPNFDPASIGQIVRVRPNGQRSYAQVTMPTGLLWHQGSLYSSAWSVASFFDIPNAGQVVRVAGSAFTP